MKNLLILLTLVALTGMASAANLLTNGDFLLGQNDPLDPTQPNTLNPVGWVEVISGGWSNRETNAGNPPYGDFSNYHYAMGRAGGYGNLAYQDVAGTAGVTYSLSADMSLDAWWMNNAYLKIEFYNSGGTAPANMVGSIQMAAITQPGYDRGVPWGNHSIKAIAPAGTATVRAILGTWGEGGTARFDNAVLEVLTKATGPNPGNSAVVGSTQAELSWTNPAAKNPADTITCDVYFLDAGLSKLTKDPNMGPTITDAGVVQIANDLAAATVMLPGSVLPLKDNHYYYWAVHCTDPNSPGSPVTTKGDIWYFYTGDAKPVVNAGLDQYNWVSKEDGDGNPLEYTITVVGTYTDDGKSPIADVNFVNLSWAIERGEAGVQKVSQTWTPGPGTHTSGTVTAVYKTVAGITTISGYWNLQLQVTDSAGTSQDTVRVQVDADCATAAANDPGDPYDGYYDSNGDCIINLTDFADFAAAWLKQSVKYE